MPKKSVWSKCKICGKEARLVKYSSKGHTGKIYHYIKFIHPDGVAHYYRLPSDISSSDEKTYLQVISNFDLFEEMILTRMGNGSYRFTEIKQMFEAVRGENVSNTTIYRAIKRFLKMGLIDVKREDHTSLYSKGHETVFQQEFLIKKMAISYIFSKGHLSVTLFVNVQNLGTVLLAKIPIELSVGPMESLDSINLRIFDEKGRIPPSRIVVNYSYSRQTGISIGLNSPLKKDEEEILFVIYDYKTENAPFKVFVQADINSAKVNIEVDPEDQVSVKKTFVDGLREFEPPIQRTRLENQGRVSLESEFEMLKKGEIITISVRKKQ